MVRAHGNGVSRLAGGRGAISATGEATHRREGRGRGEPRHSLNYNTPARPGTCWALLLSFLPPFTAAARETGALSPPSSRRGSVAGEGVERWVRDPHQRGGKQGLTMVVSPLHADLSSPHLSCPFPSPRRSGRFQAQATGSKDDAARSRPVVGEFQGRGRLPTLQAGKPSSPF